MPADFNLKLLELTSQQHRILLDYLAQELQLSLSTLASQTEGLRDRGIVTVDEVSLGLDGRQRMMLAEELINSGRDPQRVSRFLDWREFEDFAVRSFEKNGFRTAKHVVFKTKGSRREVDVLAWNDTFLFAVDCKHWLRGLSPAKIRNAVHAQVERCKALANGPEILRRFRVLHPSGRKIVPVVLTLGDSRRAVVDGVPIVPVSRLVGFLYGISPLDRRFFMFPVKIVGMGPLEAREPKA